MLDAALARTPVYIAGVAESPLGKVADQTELSMVALAAREALDEAGLKLRDVDGIFVNYMGEEGSVQVGEYLGIQPRFGDSTDVGGGSFEAFIHHAMLAIAAGRCEVALVTYASRQRSRRARTRELAPDSYTLTGQFEAPYGLMMPISHYALLAARRMHEFGITAEQMAEVAVAARRWAQLNPKAWSRDPLSVEDVLASPMVSSPYHKLDCCLVTDGGGAVVVTTKERARDAAKRPVRVLGAGESHTQWHVSQVADMTVSPGAVAAREALGMAGVTAADVDVLEPYDNFTGAVLQHLEDLGFCGRGEAGAFVEGGRLAPGGALPAMTMGGGLSYCHPGALGILLLIEAVRQLRGEAGERQVDGAEIAVAHGIGGLTHSTSATVVLGRD
ncbi:MAG: acetyl-CoA acetyltransferase [Kiloniellales bacterium]